MPDYKFNYYPTFESTDLEIYQERWEEIQKVLEELAKEEEKHDA